MGRREIRGAVQKENSVCKLLIMTTEEFNMSFLPEGFKAEKVQDFEGDGGFEVMKGNAIAILEKVTRDQGEWPSGDVKDQVSFQWRIKDKVSGNCHPNRVVFKKYGMVDGQYSTGAENRAKLANDLCTAGYDVDLSSEEAFYASLPGAVGTVANLRLGNYNDKQTVRVVEKFAATKPSAKSEEKVPF